MPLIRHVETLRFFVYLSGLPLALLLTLPGMAVADNGSLAKTSIERINPGEIAFGKPATISLALDNLPGETMVALQPAAPFATHTLPLPRPARLLAHYKDIVFTATDNRIYSLGFTAPFAQILASIQTDSTITALHVYDRYLLCVTETNTILLYSIDAAPELRLQRTITLDGAITAFAVDAGKVYALLDKQEKQSKQKVVIVELAVAREKSRSSVMLQHRFNALAVQGAKLYLTGDGIGVQIVDFSDPGKPLSHPPFRFSAQGQGITVDNNLAFVAGGAFGMTVYEVSDPRRIQWLGSHSKMGPVNAVAVYQGIIAIVNNADERLLSLDVSNPLLPITDSMYKPQGRIHDILVNWPYVYVAGNAGVERVDFSSSAAIQISNEGINQGGSRRAFIHDNIAYVADWFSGLHMYDISIPHSPRHLGNYHTPGSSKGVVVRDNIAFVGDDDHGLQVIDISNPQHPQKLSEVLSTGLAYTMKLVDNRLYLADHRGGFHIIDVSDVRQPKVLGSFDTPGKSWAMDVADGIAYVADDASGLLVFDVRDPGAIAMIGQFNPGGYAEDVTVAGGHAYVAFFDKGFYILDISNPREPRLTGHTPIPGNARSVSLDGTYAYIAGWESGLQVVDISQLSAPKIVAYYDTDGSAWGADIYKNHAYIWDWWGGVKVVNISNPLQPQFAGQYHGRGMIGRLAIRGDFLYTANGAAGMQVYDIKNPLNPIWATGLDISGSVRDIALAGDKAYLAADDEGIVIADIADPFYAKWLGRLQTPGRILRLSGDDGLLIAKDKRAGVLLVDVSQPANARVVFQLPIKCNDFTLQGRHLYLSSAEHGLTVYGVDARQQLVPLAHYRTEQEALWIRASGDNVYLSESGVGIHVLQHHLQNRDKDMRKVGFFAFSGAIDDMQVRGNRLYVASNSTGILDIDISEPSNPTLSVLYPATVTMSSVAINDDAIFVGGDKTVNSVSRLPSISLKHTSEKHLELALPAGLPMGNYQFSLVQPDGSKQVLEETVSVKPAKSNKPKFTMEDFKKIMEQQKLNSGSNASSP